MKSNYSNVAQLKELMTAPPMTAAQHAEVMRKRIAHRRMVDRDWRDYFFAGHDHGTADSATPGHQGHGLERGARGLAALSL